MEWEDLEKFVEPWLKPFHESGVLNREPRKLACAITNYILNNKEAYPIQRNGTLPINTSVVTTFIYRKAAPLYAENSEERTGIVLALGYSLVNLRANPQNYLHDVTGPTNESDKLLLLEAFEDYPNLVKPIQAKNPEYLEQLKPLIPTATLTVRRRDGSLIRPQEDGEMYRKRFYGDDDAYRI